MLFSDVLIMDLSITSMYYCYYVRNIDGITDRPTDVSVNRRMKESPSINSNYIEGFAAEPRSPPRAVSFLPAVQIQTS